MRTFSHPVSTQPAVPDRRSLPPRTAFVLGGGGSLGAMQVGMVPINPRIVIGGLANQRDHLVPNRGPRRLAARHLLVAESVVA